MAPSLSSPRQGASETSRFTRRCDEDSGPAEFVGGSEMKRAWFPRVACNPDWGKFERTRKPGNTAIVDSGDVARVDAGGPCDPGFLLWRRQWRQPRRFPSRRWP